MPRPIVNSQKALSVNGVAERIACIGWGSLVKEWGSLSCNGVWAEVGPVIAVEFAREFQEGRMTIRAS